MDEQYLVGWLGFLTVGGLAGWLLLRNLISSRTAKLHERMEDFRKENKADHMAAQESRQKFQQDMMRALGRIEGRLDIKEDE